MNAEEYVKSCGANKGKGLDVVSAFRAGKTVGLREGKITALAMVRKMLLEVAWVNLRGRAWISKSTINALSRRLSKMKAEMADD